MSLSISQVSFEHHRTALGIGESTPRISWRFEGNVSNWYQSSYEIEVQRQGETSSFHVNSTNSVLVPWPSDPLHSGEEATVRVRSFGRHANSPWSEPATVEPGLLSEDDWRDAAAIVSDRPNEVNATHRPIYFRKDFDIDEDILAARLYITALGVYEAEINGEAVGDIVLAPGWQSYHNRHEYNTYDVTDLLRGGQNTIGVAVGEGWYAGRLAWDNQRNIYGDTLGLLSLLAITTPDGETTYIPSDETWQSSTGPIVASEIYDGETYNSTLEIEGWSTPDFDASKWLGTHEVEFDKSVLAAPDAPPVRRIEERKLENIFKSESGKTVLDFGQNLVGWLRVRVKGPRGSTIRFVHTEVMEDGEVATRPLRTARATDNLTLSGEEQEWEPSFTFHGFRYVQVDGWPEETELNADSITAIVINSDMERTGFFKSSNELLNKLHENIIWSMRGNFFSIPTDCPQRDERLGWTGDIHAFVRTANFLYDTAGFLRGWLKDVYSEQLENNNAPPSVIPNVIGMASPTAIWGDAIVAVPWALFQTFGDKALLREQHPAAQLWLDKGILRNEVRLWNRSAFQFGDWLDPLAPADSPGSGTTSASLVADAYLVHVTELLANISTYLDLSNDAERYNGDRTRLAAAWRDAWISDNGTVANETQTGLALPLYFGLFDQESEYVSAISRLTHIVEENEYKIGTGFAGTHLIGHALSKHDATDTFYKMLLQEEVPGWLYQVKLNGTTTWERWDSLLPDGSVNPGEMTSFNHYAYGSVGSWMHENIGGLTPAEPGWRRFNVDVKPGGGLTYAETRFVTAYGVVGTRWAVERGVFRLAVSVPPNTQAVVNVPGRVKGGKNRVVVGSGVYRFESRLEG
ncbi:bacterial alpha-L-rhamnosidase-domain-containing protein [Aspergillus karnatakaensis]|uniref:bacterial alpha-L-rhamnosidase-domain-containing protein n=1 Tax=Aspergillus karnatakaensis TaxID=1810916 RepID=UPI003CCD37D8